MKHCAALVFAWTLGFAAALSQGAEEGTTILSDDFASLNPGWGEADETKRVEGHKLIVNLNPKLVHRNIYRTAKFDNADIRIKVREAKGGMDQSAGIIFWAADRDNCYAALVQADGNFLVTRRINGKTITPVLMMERPQVRPGIGETNALRVVTSGNRATIFVNDQQVATFRGFPPEGPSKIGVHAESGEEPCTWEFSELRIFKGPLAAESKTAQDDKLLVADDFSEHDPAWGYANDEKRVENHKLLVSLEGRRRQILLYGGSLFSDVDVSVKVAQSQPWRDNIVGLAFWANGRADICTFLVDPKGEVYAGQILEGKWKGMNILKGSKGKLKLGEGEINELRVVTLGKEATLFVNGQKVFAYKGAPPEGGSRVGLVFETYDKAGTVAFSDFQVRQP